MKISVLSGKGGTGKTLVAVNLAAAISNSCYVDCDVEEPNGRLFFEMDSTKEDTVTIPIPRFDADRCNGCMECVTFCAFHALAYIQDKPLLFDNVCHSCGGCQIVCKQNAVTEVEKEVGSIEFGTYQDTLIYTGAMKVGEESGVPIIKALLHKLDQTKETIIDCPPGSGCMVMESIKDTDYCLLVAEPTEFGVHNLKMVYELAKSYEKLIGVILNKCMDGNNPSEEFCKENNIDIVGRIPFTKRIGSLSSEGKLLVENDESYKMMFESIWQEVNRKVSR